MEKQLMGIPKSHNNGASQFGLDTSVKVHVTSAIHNTTMAMNMIKAVGKR